MATLIKNARVIDVVNLRFFKGYLLIENNEIREAGRGDSSFSLEKCCDKDGVF